MTTTKFQFKSPSSTVTFIISSIFIHLAFSIVINNYSVSATCFNSIISFGDSIADTGNGLHLSKNTAHYGFPPYGETFFHQPTGRVSDGRLIIDFIAEHFGLPLVPPFFGMKATKKEFGEGVNYAVVGATALDYSYLAERGIINQSTNVSLGIELVWFKKMLANVCQGLSDCDTFFQSTLFIVGEIGGNDIFFALDQGKTLQDVQLLVEPILTTISLFIKELIGLGATKFLVPGNFPIGCIPAFLSKFYGSNEDDYDHTNGCITWLNGFAEDYNKKLQMKLHHLRHLYPHTTIIYADYYNSIMQIINYPTQYGFNKTLSACCGSGGPYNYTSSGDCGATIKTSCDNPSSYVSWDGVHMTEATYRLMAKGILEGIYTMPPINSVCSSTYSIDRISTF